MRGIVPALLFLLATPTLALAQRPEVGVDLGLAKPAGSLAENRNAAGPSALFSLGFGTRGPGVGVRAELGWTRLGAEEPASRAVDELTARSARASLVYTLPSPSRPYLLFGAGAYRLKVPAERGQTAAGLHAGAGVRFSLGPVRLVGEVQPVVVLSSYESDLLDPMVYLPLTLGVRL